MKTSTVIGVVAALIVAGGAWYWLQTGAAPLAQNVADYNYKNATYTIEGQ